jgi:hypothetical protein
MESRSRIAVVLVVVASVLAFASLFAVWLNRQVLDTDNWTATSSELLADPLIRDQVAVYLVDELYANVDVTEEIRTALPDRFKPLAGPAAGGLRNLAERAADDILARPRAQQAWESANREAHLLLLKVLDGGGPAVSTEGGAVVLDLKSLLAQLADRVGIGGRLSAALPAGAAQITVMRSDQLSAAQDLSKVARGLPVLLVGLSLALFGIALAVAPARRRKTVRGYGAGLIVAGVAALVAESLAGQVLVDSLARTAAAEPVVERVWSIVTPLLHEATVATIGYGGVMVLGAWLAGPTRAATAVRRALAPYLRTPALAYAGLAVLLAAVVLWWAPTPATRNPATAALLVALVALGFEGLRRKTAREHPDASREAALAAHHDHLRRAGRRVRDGWGRVGTEVDAVTHHAPGGLRTVQHAPAAAYETRLDGLERLTRLRDSGTLGDDEFEVEKARLLAATVPEPVENGVATAEAPPAS